MKRVAVIGSGISGMAAAYLLSPLFDVSVYEKSSVAGGHTRTKSIDYNGKNIAVDTGFIVFNEVNYPELVGLFRHLNVATEKSNMSFGFSLDGGKFEWGADNINAVFGQRSNLVNPSFYRMMRDVLRFFKEAPKCLANDYDLSLGELLNQLNMGDEFKGRFILPMGAAIWSCPANLMLDFSAKTFVRFFKNHGLLTLNGQHQWYTVTGGAQQYVNKITRAQNIKLSSGVKRVWNEGDKLGVQSISGDVAFYDHVIIAAHADEALAMLDNPSAEENAVLGAFKYQDNKAYLHCDATQMPKRRRCWSSWNYSENGDQNNMALTYWMNNLQNIDPSYPLFVTLNPNKPISADNIFDEHVFKHPIFTAEAISAQARIPEIQGKRNIWFCGAYQRYGFHEDGLMSAVAVAKSLGANIPWH